MSIRRKTEAAMVAVIKDYYSGEVYAGTRGDVLNHPCVVVFCSGGEEIPIGSGNQMIEMVVSVQDQIDEAAATNSTDRFNDAVDNVSDALQIDDLATQLTSKVLNFGVNGIQSITGPEQEFDDQEAMITENFVVTLYAANKDI